MKAITTATGLFGPFNVVEVLADRYRADGTELQFSVLGASEVVDASTVTFPPPVLSPEAEATRQEGIRSQIKALEDYQNLPRATREFMLRLSEGMFTPEQLAVNPGYQAVKAFDLEIKALRDQLL